MQFRNAAHFAEEAARIFEGVEREVRRLVPGTDVMVEHVGSTAVPETITKGDVDVQVRVPQARFAEADSAFAAMWPRNAGNPRTDDFASFELPGYPLPTGLHLTATGSEWDGAFVAARERLRADADARERYLVLKARFVGRDQGEYREAKAEFFAALLAAPVLPEAAPDPTVRPMRGNDAEAVLDLLEALWANALLADHRYGMAPNGRASMAPLVRVEWPTQAPFVRAFVAEIAGRLVGFVQGAPVPAHPVLARPPTVRIGDLYVAPLYRRRGVARALVGALRSGAAAAGFPRLEVGTLARDARAVAFWRSVGLEELGLTLVGSA